MSYIESHTVLSLALGSLGFTHPDLDGSAVNGKLATSPLPYDFIPADSGTSSGCVRGCWGISGATLQRSKSNTSNREEFGQKERESPRPSSANQVETRERMERSRFRERLAFSCCLPPCSQVCFSVRQPSLRSEARFAIGNFASLAQKFH
jgi:hypothetical protein